MKSSFVAALLLAMATLSPAAPAADEEVAFVGAQVRDNRGSFIDVPARLQWLRTTVPGQALAARLTAAADCEQPAPALPPSGPMVIPPRYASGNHGPVNPAYGPIVAVYRDFEKRVASLANRYVASGDAHCAQRLLGHLADWAKAETLLDYHVTFAPGMSNQAWFQAEWSLAAASLALSQVVREPSLNPEQLEQVIAWLHRASKKQVSHPGGPSTCCNNHAYWRGLHATMIGVLAHDDELFRWGLGRYAVAMHQLADDGSWPLEMARHEQALHYQNFALLPLTLIAEIAQHQGLDLYALKVQGRDLHGAVAFLAAMWSEHGKGAAPVRMPTMDLRAFVTGAGDLAWAEFYRARFGRNPLDLLMLPVANPRTGGNATLLVSLP